MLAALTELLAPPVCWSCSALSHRDDPLCIGCRAALHRLAPEPVILGGVGVWAPVAYSGPARDLVGALKFRGAMRVADAMAAQMVANAPPEFLDGGVAVPVPLHPKRRRSRAYNQAAVLADTLASRAGIEVVDCLVRAGPSVTQMGRARNERMAGPVGSIEVVTCGAAAAQVAPHRVLLVDDVVTTGATLAGCRDALTAAGGRDVRAVAFARTIGR